MMPDPPWEACGLCGVGHLPTDPHDPDQYAAGHWLAGRLSNGPAWSAGDRDMVSFCSCGLAFYGATREQSDHYHNAHGLRERTSR